MASSNGLRTASFLVLAALGAGGAGVARADEAFLCGPDTVVYVKPAELEQKKRTDPCIAAYFGLKAENSAATGAVNSAPLPQAGGKTLPVKVLPLKKLEAPEAAEPIAFKEERSALLAPPAAAPGTDYRNVRVINAASDDAQWFRHQK